MLNKGMYTREDGVDLPDELGSRGAVEIGGSGGAVNIL